MRVHRNHGEDWILFRGIRDTEIAAGKSLERQGAQRDDLFDQRGYMFFDEHDLLVAIELYGISRGVSLDGVPESDSEMLVNLLREHNIRISTTQ